MYSSVILDIHENHIKAGFSGNFIPVCTNICEELTNDSTDHQLKWTFEQQFRKIFSSQLLLTSRHERVVVIESEYLDVPTKDKIIRVLLHDLQVKSVAFLPRTPCILISRGIRNGIVIDINWNRSSVVAIGELTEISPPMSTIRGINWILDNEKQEKISLRAFLDNPDQSLNLRDIFFDDDKYNDDEEQSILQLIIKLMNHLDIASRGHVSKHIIIQSHVGYKIPDVIKDEFIDVLKRKGWSNCSWTSSPGSWVGASLYLSTAKWGYDGRKPVEEIRKDDLIR